MNEESRDLDNLAGLEAGQLALVTEQPERGLLADEVHARPPMRLNAPAKVSHLVMLSGEDAAPDERSHLALLCESFDVSVPDHAARQFFADFGAFKLRWERHTEFAAWTFVRRKRDRGGDLRSAVRRFAARPRPRRMAYTKGG